MLRRIDRPAGFSCEKNIFPKKSFQLETALLKKQILLREPTFKWAPAIEPSLYEKRNVLAPFRNF